MLKRQTNVKKIREAFNVTMSKIFHSENLKDVERGERGLNNQKYNLFNVKKGVGAQKQTRKSNICLNEVTDTYKEKQVVRDIERTKVWVKVCVCVCMCVWVWVCDREREREKRKQKMLRTK